MYCTCKHSTDVPTVQSCCQKAAVSKWRKKYLEKGKSSRRKNNTQKEKEKYFAKK